MTGEIREEFDIPLNDLGDFTRVRILRQGKQILDFLAQYEALIDNVSYPVIRYDGRHGHPHQDVLDWNGNTIAKVWAPFGMTNGQALTDAIDDISANWEHYRKRFMEMRP